MDGSLMDYQLCDDLVVTVGDLCWIIVFAAIYSMPITPECSFSTKNQNHRSASCWATRTGPAQVKASAKRIMVDWVTSAAICLSKG